MRFIFIVLLSVATCSGATEGAPPVASLVPAAGQVEASPVTDLVKEFDRLKWELESINTQVERIGWHDARAAHTVMGEHSVSLYVASAQTQSKLRKLARTMSVHPEYDEVVRCKIERWL